MASQKPTILHALVLRTLKYNERSNILWLYSQEAGRVSVVIPAGNGKSSLQFRAVTQPLSVVEVVVRQSGGGLMRASDVRPMKILHSLQCDPSKITVSMFIAEFLTLTIAEGESDNVLFNFLTNIVDYLECCEQSVANFHIAFLFALLQPYGIIPDFSTYKPGSIFDMGDGSFRDSIPLNSPHWLSASESELLVKLSRITLSNCHMFKFSRNQRNAIIDMILRYYSIHYRSLASLNTLSVLRSLYN